ncbi:prenyltransferase/squalene oxidase repeat-containing protein [Neorhodopirellula pilleata]|uniref:Geranylgeranyl transferase type II subunit beta n=1 Tax=Neorhodopirellula pilleata TaxID=2714738 RepID=A0A5C6ATR0_9BACT|nr:prenyltransferase/squalene oxidase repeat-containing protein [Neorhodopirellula pilleata]TWU01534.1 Prenyltransferase and squalene oxidase repeat protein [Neorhodopirellula pilleata]
MSGYLQELTLRLALGASQLEPLLKQRHGAWLQSCQHADGGFAGREGQSDPYYTAFALRSLWILGELNESVAGRAGRFLRDRLQRRDSVIDLISLIFAAAILEMATGEVVISDDDTRWRDNVADLLSTLRCGDGGFAKTPEGRAGSTYQTFLSVLCFELMDVPVPEPDRIAEFLESQRHDEGGYLEIRVAKRAGVNPTAAAIGTLKTLGYLDVADQTDTIEFLLEMQSDEGGLTANTRIPFADLLSSFTGLTTLVDLEAADQISLARLRSYVQSMQSPSGGFVGFALDQTADVEYTFYGLAGLAMIATIPPDLPTVDIRT